MVCERCGKFVHESHPHYVLSKDKILCYDCAFIKGKITATDYLNFNGIWLDSARAAVNKNGEICVVLYGKFPWEKKDKDYRQSKEYSEWRNIVFRRDSFQCQICKAIGGRLEAHHIFPFKKYPDKRFDIDNGVTLCKACHKKVHKEKSCEWLHTG